MRLNENITKLEQNYLFAEIAKRVRLHCEKYPDAKILSLGINDVTRPLAPAVCDAMSIAAQEMRSTDRFHGYGDVQGELSLRRAICGYYRTFKVGIEPEDVFVSDGAKSDLANLCDLFAPDSTVLLPNPVYPSMIRASWQDERSYSRAVQRRTAFCQCRMTACIPI